MAATPVIVTHSFPATVSGYDAAINDPNLTPVPLTSFTAFDAAKQQWPRMRWQNEAMPAT